MAAPSMAVCTSRVVGALLLLVGMAVPVLGAAGSNAGIMETTLTDDEIIFGVCCMLTGIYLCFFGYRVLKILVFITGMYIGYWLCYSIMYNIDVDYGANEEWIIFGVSLGVGLIFGVLLVCIQICLFNLGIFFIGFLSGFMMSLWILSLMDPKSPLVSDDLSKWLFLIGVALFVGILALIFQKVIIIIGSSYVGAYILFYGIDIFAQTGFYEAAQAIIRGSDFGSQKYCDSDECIIMMCACILCFILGMVVQFRMNRDRDHKREHDNENVYVQIN